MLRSLRLRAKSALSPAQGLQHLIPQTDPVICNRITAFRIICIHRHRDPAALRIVHHAVADQITEHSLKENGIALDVNSLTL